MPGQLPSESQRAFVSLSKPMRWLAGTIGLLAEAAGIAAIFIKNNNAGSLALIALGAAFLLIAITGHGIRSVKIGSTEFVMQEVASAQEAKFVGDDERAYTILDHLLRLALPVAGLVSTQSTTRPVQSLPTGLGPGHEALWSAAGASVAAVNAALFYEGSVSDALSQVLSEMDGILLAPAPGPVERFDWIARIGDENYGVEIRLGDQIRPEAFANSLRAKVAGVGIDLAGVFVIVNGPPAEEVTDRLMAAASGFDMPLAVWFWRPEDGIDNLRQGVVFLREQDDRED
jgi:hypothetical protein